MYTMLKEELVCGDIVYVENLKRIGIFMGTEGLPEGKCYVEYYLGDKHIEDLEDVLPYL